MFISLCWPNGYVFCLQWITVLFCFSIILECTAVDSSNGGVYFYPYLAVIVVGQFADRPGACTISGRYLYGVINY